LAKVNIEEIIDHLSYDMRRALADAISETLPHAEFDEREVFRAFQRAVRRKCNTWEDVPNQHVRSE
jgi:hypothetical protein